MDDLSDLELEAERLRLQLQLDEEEEAKLPQPQQAKPNGTTFVDDLVEGGGAVWDDFRRYIAQARQGNSQPVKDIGLMAKYGPMAAIGDPTDPDPEKGLAFTKGITQNVAIPVTAGLVTAKEKLAGQMPNHTWGDLYDQNHRDVEGVFEAAGNKYPGQEMFGSVATPIKAGWLMKGAKALPGVAKTVSKAPVLTNAAVQGLEGAATVGGLDVIQQASGTRDMDWGRTQNVATLGGLLSGLGGAVTGFFEKGATKASNDIIDASEQVAGKGRATHIADFGNEVRDDAYKPAEDMLDRFSKGEPVPARDVEWAKTVLAERSRKRAIASQGFREKYGDGVPTMQPFDEVKAANDFIQEGQRNTTLFDPAKAAWDVAKKESPAVKAIEALRQKAGDPFWRQNLFVKLRGMGDVGLKYAPRLLNAAKMGDQQLAVEHKSLMETDAAYRKLMQEQNNK